jgi:hypothetical protein
MNNVPDSTEQSRDDMNQAIGPEVHVPGPYPSADAPTSGEAANAPSEQQAQTQVTRDADSLGDLSKGQSMSAVAEESGGLGSPALEEEKQQKH